LYDLDVLLGEGKTYKLNGIDYAFNRIEEIQLMLSERAYVEE
jgi:hypothetical protein